MHNLLIATVGGAPPPVAESILHWRPERILFVPSADTAKGIDDIQKYLAEKEYSLGAGQYDTIRLSDPQDFSQCVREMRSGLESRVVEWRTRGAGYECVVDFTGGTKCMSAALGPWSRDHGQTPVSPMLAAENVTGTMSAASFPAASK